jgi:hypothetical protein
MPVKPNPDAGVGALAVDLSRAGEICTRRLTVDIRIEAQAADDSPLAPLVAEALQEFISAAPTAMHGKFETKAGLDIAWSMRNQYFDAAGRPVATKGE